MGRSATLNELIERAKDTTNWTPRFFQDLNNLDAKSEEFAEFISKIKSYGIYDSFNVRYTAWATELNRFESSPSFKVISADELDNLNLPPIQWIVDNLLPTGLAMIAAPPKYYKSYFALQLCIAICRGEKFLNRQCSKAACLYLDLESSRRRPQNRLRQILGNSPKPDNLYIATLEQEEGFKRIGNGFEEQLSLYLSSNPDIRFVVIDVFKEVRRSQGKGENQYDKDYSDLQALRKLSQQHDICIFIVHHTRKMQDDDAFNMIGGSNGVMGALDTVMVITRESRNSNSAILHIEGRDIAHTDIGIRFDTDTMTWEYEGTEEEMAQRKRRKSYDDNPVIQVVKAMVDDNSGTWSGNASDIKHAADVLNINLDGMNTTWIGKTISDFEGELWGWDYITTERRRNGSSRAWTFTRDIKN